MRISRLVTLFHLQTSQLVQLSTTLSFNQVKVLNLSVPLVLLLKFLGQEGKYVLVRLQSGEVRMVLGTCRATIGTVGNEQQSLINLGKAGRNRWKGIRPTVRGSVMNPNDHPHGGGEGKAPVGRKAPSTPWGKPALGLKTRNKKAKSDKLIVRRRNQK